MASQVAPDAPIDNNQTSLVVHPDNTTPDTPTAPATSTDLHDRFGIPNTLSECDQVGEPIKKDDADIIREMKQSNNDALRTLCRSKYESYQRERSTADQLGGLQALNNSYANRTDHFDFTVAADVQKGVNSAMDAHREERLREGSVENYLNSRNQLEPKIYNPNESRTYAANNDQNIAFIAALFVTVIFVSLIGILWLMRTGKSGR